MKYNTTHLNDEAREALDDLYYPLRRNKKIKSYSELILKLIKFYRKRKQDERDTNTNKD